MNRRSFFRSLALLAGAASVSPHVFIPQLEPVRWKRPARVTFIPNPDYYDAPYEIALLGMKDTPYPLRFVQAFNGQFETVLPFIQCINGTPMPVRGSVHSPSDISRYITKVDPPKSFLP